MLTSAIWSLWSAMRPPTMLAIKSAPASHIQTMDGSRRNAEAVARRVTGLTIGAASRKVVDSETLRPLTTSPRATGTFPHSQTGMNMPKKETKNLLTTGSLGSRSKMRRVGT